jgi:hypothetical protein
MQIFNDGTVQKGSYNGSDCTAFEKQLTVFDCINKLPEGYTKIFLVHFEFFFKTSSRSNALQYNEFTEEDLLFYKNTKIKDNSGDFMYWIWSNARNLNRMGGYVASTLGTVQLEAFIAEINSKGPFKERNVLQKLAETVCGL